jgi:hypothetical protein
VREIKISFLRNDARDTPVTIHVGPREHASSPDGSLRDGKGGPDPFEGFRGHPLGIADPADIC